MLQQDKADWGQSIDEPGLLWQRGDVKLTNDEYTAEWIIEGHQGDGRSIEEMKTNIKQIFAMRKVLKYWLRRSEQKYHVGKGEIGIQPIGRSASEDIYVYNMHDVSKGAAQITVKYRKKETLARLNEVNMARHLPGGAVKEDVSYLQSGGFGWGWSSAQDGAGAAKTLRQSLTANSEPLITESSQYLSKDDVGLLKLMILNDVMAVLLTRYVADGDAHTHEKNMQRYFPKSKRPQYVHALAHQPLPAKALFQLRSQLWSDVESMAAILLKAIDLGQLDLQHILRREHAPQPQGPIKQGEEQAPDPTRSLLEAQHSIKKGAVDNKPRLALQKAVFGDQLSELNARIRQVIHAYTEQPGEQKHTAVVSSKGYAKVDPQEEAGAVYELRGDEVTMSEGDLTRIFATLESLYKAAL
ncbi:MAG: hypothetical protein R2911_23640 [Caldilineaceae bacterium]